MSEELSPAPVPKPTGSFDLVVLSPHLDDGVLSTGGLIHQARAREERVLVVTLFTADEPAEPPSKLARDLHRWFGLGRGVLDARRREDLAACAVLGAETLHLALPEAVYRLDEDAGEVFYEDLGALFGPVHAGDARQLLPLLERRLSELPEAARVLIPLGVGGHVDHRLVRDAAERLFGPSAAELLHYEDYPYVQRRGALKLALRPRRAWEPVVVPLADEDLRARLEAAAAYTSQIEPLFGDPRRMARRMRRYARRAGGERLWRRRPG